MDGYLETRPFAGVQYVVWTCTPINVLQFRYGKDCQIYFSVHSKQCICQFMVGVV